MNDYPSNQEENDESYFNSGNFRHDLTDPPSSHADALHADALGRDITSLDTARSDYLGAESRESAASQIENANFASDTVPYPTESYGQNEFERNEFEHEVSGDMGYAGSGNSAAPSEQLYGSHRSIDSTYFNITSSNDGPVAGLNVLMDTGGQAIRSELYLYEESNEADKQEAIRQANQILKRQFSSGQGEFDNQMLELRIFETQQKYATVYVDLPERDAAAAGDGVRQSAPHGKGGSASSSRTSLGGTSFLGGFFAGGLSRLWPLALAALALLFGLGILWWILSSFLGGGGFDLAGNTNGTQGEVAIESASDGSQLSADFDPDKPILNLGGNQGETVQGEVVQGEVAQGAAGQDTETVQGEVVQGQPSGDSQTVVQPAALEWVNPSEENRNGLPESVRADPNIRGSSRVRVREGIQIMLRSYPGPAAGTELGVMQDGDTGIVVGGPYYTEGETDTIVWWYVRLDSGEQSEAWVAANTSNLTLLEVAQ